MEVRILKDTLWGCFTWDNVVFIFVISNTDYMNIEYIYIYIYDEENWVSYQLMSSVRGWHADIWDYYKILLDQLLKNIKILEFSSALNIY